MILFNCFSSLRSYGDIFSYEAIDGLPIVVVCDLGMIQEMLTKDVFADRFLGEEGWPFFKDFYGGSGLHGIVLSGGKKAAATPKGK